MAYNKETGMYEGFIYKIWNDVNDCIYIGRTYRTVEKRWKEHVDYAKRGFKTKLYDAMREYGLDHFNIDVVDTFTVSLKQDIKQLCIDNEMKWIKFYKSNNAILYNETEGGYDYDGLKNEEKPVIMYDLFCNKINEFNSISEASDYSGIDNSSISACALKHKDIYSARNYIWRYASQPLTDDEIIELNQRYRGVWQYDFDGCLINEFYRPHEAAKYIENTFNITANGANIVSCMCGKKKSAYDYVWRYRGDSFDKYELPIIKNVEQYSLDGKYIATYEKAVIASNETKISINAIRSCCRGTCKTGDGYIWCYKGDSPNTYVPITKKAVDRYDLNKNYIDSFESMAEAERQTGISAKCISLVCNNTGLYKTAGGFIWRFSNEDISTYKY